jgi:hypothetical protein
VLPDDTDRRSTSTRLHPCATIGIVRRQDRCPVTFYRVLGSVRLVSWLPVLVVQLWQFSMAERARWWRIDFFLLSWVWFSVWLLA